MYTYNVEISRVVDGDTIDVIIDLGFSVLVKERVRLAGVDTPESRTRDLREKRFGKLATARVKELLPSGHKFIAESKAYNTTGKFGRAMLDFNLPDGRKLAAALIEEHLAVPYDGQNKADIRKEHEANWDRLEAADQVN